MIVLISLALSNESLLEIQLKDGEVMVKSVAFFDGQVKVKAFVVTNLIQMDLLPSCKTFEHNPSLEV